MAALVLGVSHGQESTTSDLALGGPVRQGRAQGQLDHLARGPLPVAAGLGAEGDATAGRSGGPAPSPAGPGRCPSA